MQPPLSPCVTMVGESRDEPVEVQMLIAEGIDDVALKEATPLAPHVRDTRPAEAGGEVQSQPWLLWILQERSLQGEKGKLHRQTSGCERGKEQG